MSKGVLKVFSEVAHQYELVNHVLTFGLDIPWRTRAAQVAASGGGVLWLEVCSGTGEMAVNLKKLAGSNTKIVVSDFSMPMISRASVKKELSEASISLADSQHLPFPDNTFDLVAISFATRNITPTRAKLKRPGAHAGPHPGNRQSRERSIPRSCRHGDAGGLGEHLCRRRGDRFHPRHRQRGLL